MQQDERIKRKKEMKRNHQLMEPSSSYEKEHRSNHQKPDLENQDEQRLSMARKRRGRQLNSDPTQRYVVYNISQNLKKKMTN